LKKSSSIALAAATDKQSPAMDRAGDAMLNRQQD